MYSNPVFELTLIAPKIDSRHPRGHIRKNQPLLNRLKGRMKETMNPPHARLWCSKEYQHVRKTQF
jgi:hypothetical protein